MSVSFFFQIVFLFSSLDLAGEAREDSCSTMNRFIMLRESVSGFSLEFSLFEFYLFLC